MLVYRQTFDIQGTAPVSLPREFASDRLVIEVDVPGAKPTWTNAGTITRRFLVPAIGFVKDESKPLAIGKSLIDFAYSANNFYLEFTPFKWIGGDITISVWTIPMSFDTLKPFNYIQKTAPLNASIGLTWRKLDESDRIIAEAFWDGDRWLSNQLKAAIIASSGVANFPAFVNPSGDLWVEHYIFSGFGAANHTNADYYTFSLNQNAIYYDNGYSVAVEPLASFETKNLINAGTKFEIKITINKFVNCTSNTGMNNAISAVGSFSITRINTGIPVTPFVPKQVLFYREVIT